MRRLRRRRGLTLVELSISLLSSAALMTGLASALFVTAQTATVGQRPDDRTVQANDVIVRLTHDLQQATDISELTATAVQFTVPDRTGDGIPDIYRYSWTGTAGNPLLLSINGGAAVTVASSVQEFDLKYFSRLIKGKSSGKEILFISVNSPDKTAAVTPTASESLRINWFESWGYTVTVGSMQQSLAELETVGAASDIIFFSGEITKAITAKLSALPKSIVFEDMVNAAAMQLGSSPRLEENTEFRALDTSHYITYKMSGDFDVSTSKTSKFIEFNSLSSEAKILSERSGTKTLVVWEAGAKDMSGATTAGRRVQLPFGQTGFDFGSLTTDGLTILRRCIDWAACVDLTNAGQAPATVASTTPPPPPQETQDAVSAPLDWWSKVIQ